VEDSCTGNRRFGVMRFFAVERSTLPPLGYGGDCDTLAEISEIYLAIPTIIFLVILFAIVGGLVFLMARLLAVLPRYTFMAQDLSHKMKAYARRGADYAVRPVIFLDSLGASINRIFGKR